MAIEAPPCSSHPEAPAGWTCPECHRDLCLDCAARRKAGYGYVTVCRGCRGLANTILLPKAREPYLALVGHALAYPLSKRGQLMLLASGIVFGLFHGLTAIFPFAALASYLFVVVRTSGLGEDDVPEGDDFSHLFDLFVALAKVALAFALAAVPLVVYVTRIRTPPPTWYGYLSDPFVWFCLLLGLAWTPMAMLLSAIKCDLLVVVNPWVAFQMFVRMGRDAIVATIAFWGFVGGWLVVVTLGTVFAALVPIPFFPKMAAYAVATYFPFVASRALGLLLLARGVELDYGRPADYVEPALRNLEPDLEPQPLEFDVQPIGEAQVVPLTAFDDEAFRSDAAPMKGIHDYDIHREAAEPTEDLMPEEQFLEGAQPPKVAESQEISGDDTSDDAVRRAAAQSRFDVVAKAYRERQGAIEILSDDELLATADAALRFEDAKTAAHALKRLGRDHPQSPHAGTALVRAATLMRETLGDAAGAEKLLARVVRTYPESEAAAEAMEMLAS